MKWNKFGIKPNKYLIISILFFHALISKSQDTSLKVSAYLDMYYSADLNSFKSIEKPSFIYSHKRNNELSLNLAYLKANYNRSNVRANLALMIGNYAQYNLSHELPLAQHIFEANVGIKLSKKHQLWIDAGVFPSHIGYESAIAQDCYTLTRSLAAENSPYYESGAKLSYINKNEKLNLNILYLNGWQKIQKPYYITKPSFGLQMQYKPNKNITLNYSNFIGYDVPDSLNMIRYFHNCFAIINLNQISIISGFDIGFQDEKSWFTPSINVKYNLNSKQAIALRIENFTDKHAMILGIPDANINGLTINYDRNINSNTMWRTEFKTYQSKDNYFYISSGVNMRF